MSSYVDDYKEINYGGTNSFGMLKKKPRASRACDICRKKKVKCDNEKPACSNCLSFGYECTYLEKQKKRGPQPNYPKGLEERLERLESVLSNLAKRDSTLPSEIVEEFHSIEQSLSDESNEKSDDSIEEGISKLSIEEPKYFSYIGSSSGFYLLDGGSYYKQGRFRNFVELLCKEELYRESPLSLGPSFPPPELRESLLDYYFKVINPTIPLFLLGRHDKNLTAGDDVSELLHNSILAITAVQIPCGDSFPNPEEAYYVSRVFHARAKLILDRLVSIPSIGLLQALILLGMHPQNGWMHLGMAIRLAQELGLHRTINSQKLEPLEREKRKFLWWNCMLLDRGISSFLGRPLAIHESDCNISLPLLPENLAKEAGIDVADLAYSQRSGKSYILHIRLAHITGRILREIYTAENASQGKIKNSLRELNKALIQWEVSLPNEFKYNFKDPSQNDQYTTMLCFLHSYLLIVLNRPFLPKIGRKATVAHPSQLLCAKAASTITFCAYHYARNNPQPLNVQNGPLFTASSVHLINITSEDPELVRISKTNLKAGIECLRVSGKIFLDAKHCFALLEDLVNSQKNLDLDDVPAQPELYNPPNIGYAINALSKHMQRHDSESLIIIPDEFADQVFLQANPSNSPSPSLSAILSPVSSLMTQSSTEPTRAHINNDRLPSGSSLKSVDSPSSYQTYESPASQASAPESSQQTQPHTMSHGRAVNALYPSPPMNLQVDNHPSQAFPLHNSSSLFPNSEVTLFPENEFISNNEPPYVFGQGGPPIAHQQANETMLNPLQMDFNFEEWSTYVNQFMNQTIL